MYRLSSNKKRKALLLLLVWLMDCLLPLTSRALTSGPAQPETKSFEPAGVQDMVDLSSGSLKYNIPLLDIDGYPINLNYQSGVGIDDEASWVGLGWNLNPGAINRQVRGLPDDFAGDTIETDNYTKPKVTVGGRLTAKFELFGKALTETGGNVNGSFSVGLFNDSYTGIGAELGVNAGVSYSTPNDGMFTAGLGAGILSSTQSGVDVNASPYVCMAIKDKTDQSVTVNAGLSSSLGYNSRSGMKGFTLGESFGFKVQHENKQGEDRSANANFNLAGSTITYNTEPISPSILVPHTSSYGSFSLDVGPAVSGGYPSIGGTGYQNVLTVKTFANIKKGYGFLYAERGKADPGAVMDFIREQDNPVIPGIPNIALPIHTPDLWTFTNQTGSGQFRLYRGGSGVFFDSQAADDSKVSSTGGDYGIGDIFHGGITHYQQNATTTTRKWTTDNNYLAKGDFQDQSNTNPGNQQVFFRVMGEKGLEDTTMSAKLYGTQPLEVNISGIQANASFHTQGRLTSDITANNLVKTDRRQNRTVITYLNAKEATLGALDKKINVYPANDTASYANLVTQMQPSQHINRCDSNLRKKNHISEIMVTDDGGKRMVYGIPVYNFKQDEYSFAVGGTARNGSGAYPADNQVNVPSAIANPPTNKLGIDNYYQKEHKSGYAASYLLTAILSPDYVDRLGDGITPDDPGTAIKFNYSRTSLYRWRTPFSKATLNKCLLADPDDDKGSIVYGEKEIYYISSIETKTKIAFFITKNRRDGLGVAGWHNGGIDTTQKQKYLSEIRLYSKADLNRPIKVVKFQYDYELCRGIPNSMDAGSSDTTRAGKLTLKKIWFEYGNSDKGKYHPYQFQYNKGTSKYAAVIYNYMVTDRWGTYKPAAENKYNLNNEQYPYTNQDTTYTNGDVGIWHLSQVSLPTGGTIHITYESNDYAYVQDQKAMVMSKIQSLISASSVTVDQNSLNKARGLQINIGANPPAGVDATSWFKANYLNGSDYIYSKLYVKMATNNSRSPDSVRYDYVPCYSEVSSVTVSSGVANIMLSSMNESGVTANPVSIAAWQRMKNEYPRYAYPGFDNRVTGAGSVLAAVSSIINAAKNLSELTENFYQKANNNSYAAQVILSKSFARITKADGHKLGGGARVKRISITDNWSTLSGNGSASNSTYGQQYSYTTVENGQTISSGVAAYEPSVGNDENALKQPIPYVQKIKGAINNYFDLELPFGESLYPAPTVTYAKVTVNDLDRNGSPSQKTGSVVNEFYTCRDFPVRVTALPIIRSTYHPSTYYSLTETNSIDDLCLSQGYTISLNDMQGKQKAVHVLDQSGSEISSTQYIYQTDTADPTSLNNMVDVVNSQGVVLKNKVIGRDIEFFTDFREQESKNSGNTINIGSDVLWAAIFPIIIPHFPIGQNNDYKLFRSACALKVISTYGILKKIIKMENGSSITTENIAFDGQTGEALVSSTQNEFNKNIYSVNLPAYWAYKGMSGAWQNQGVYLQSLTTDAGGQITTSAYLPYLKGGDKLLDLSGGQRYWVIEHDNHKYLVDSAGYIQTSKSPYLVKLLQSGYGNMLTANAGTLVCLNNPITSDGHLAVVSNSNLSSLKVINASAAVYDETWAPRLQCTDQKYIPKPITTYTNHAYDVEQGSHPVPTYGDSGAYVRATIGGPDVHSSQSLWSGALTRSGVWIGDPGDTTNYLFHTYLGYQVCLDVSQTKTYFFGFSGDNATKIYLDNSPAPIDSSGNYHYWYIRPHVLTQGHHILKVTFMNSETEASAGLEIYDNTYAQLINPSTTIADLNFLFRSNGLHLNVQSFIPESDGSVSYHYRYTSDGAIPDPCNPIILPVPSPVNPYTAGIMGNWRSYKTLIYQQSRNYNDPFNNAKNNLNIPSAGYINNFYSYWYYDGGTACWITNAAATRWVTANSVTLYDKYGQQLENKDALGRYSAASFDFNGELPAAVASNAMHREIYTNSFEDSRFQAGTDPLDTCARREFLAPGGDLITQSVIDTMSHSGNYSALLPSAGVSLATVVHTHENKTTAIIKVDSVNQFETDTTKGYYQHGFEPVPSKKYIFDAWVKDGHPNDASVYLTFKMNSTTVPLTIKANVEGWKLLEGTFTTVSAGDMLLSLLPASGATILIDDIRMHPFDTQMRTYAYDDATMRLMAEIDENGFATFYEYDDEGLLVRVKKETDKGIMTLKESRSSYRKVTP